jgi:hypothetical protein
MVQPWPAGASFESAAQKGKSLAGPKSSRIEDKNDTNIMIIGYDNRVTNWENPKSPSPSTGMECLKCAVFNFPLFNFEQTAFAK